MYPAGVIVNDTIIPYDEGDLAVAKARSIQHGTDNTWVLA